MEAQLKWKYSNMEILKLLKIVENGNIKMLKMEAQSSLK